MLARRRSNAVFTLRARVGIAHHLISLPLSINTDGRLVWMRVHREFFRDSPKEFDFRPPGKVFQSEYAKFIANKNVKLGSANQPADLRKLPAA